MGRGLEAETEESINRLQDEFRKIVEMLISPWMEWLPPVYQNILSI